MTGDFSTLPQMLHNVSKVVSDRFQLSIPSGKYWESVYYGIFYDQILTLVAGGSRHHSGIRYLIILDPSVYTSLREQAAKFAWMVTGDFPCEGENVLPLSQVLQRGMERRRQTDTAKLFPSLRSKDIFTIIYTYNSGSEGTPKGVVLTHGNILSQIHGAAQIFPLDPACDRAFFCLLFPDFDSIKIMKEKSRQSQLSDAEFLETEAVAHRVQKLLGRVNAGLSPWEQIRKYCFVLHTPGVESRELTPTMKLRRHVILEKHKALIEAMYRETGQGGEYP